MARGPPKSWVEWFLSTPAGRYFVEVGMAFLTDDFNITGLRAKMQQNFCPALELIRGPYVPPDRRPAGWPSDIDQSGVRLYGLIHARFLLMHGPNLGLEQMFRKWDNCQFPECPRTFCESSRCLPFGPSEEVGESVLRMFCPNCREVYRSDDPISAAIDGAYFGPSWVHLFVQEYEQKVVPKGQVQRPPVKLFGFRIEMDCTHDCANER